MVIELRGVQFGLKSYARFQNRMSEQREFDLNSHVWFQTKFNRHFIRSIMKLFNLMANLPNNGFFVIHFPTIWLVSLKKPWNLIGCFVLLSHCHWLRKRCDLEQNWCDSWINSTTESQSDCKANQWFQNGFNKTVNCSTKPNWVSCFYNDHNMWLYSDTQEL